MLDNVVDIPLYENDVFSSEALHQPFAHYRAMRDLGPVVRLRDPDVYVLSRFKNVRDALQTPDTLICSRGTGFNDEFNTPRLPLLLQTDGDQHSRLRTEVVRPILPAQLKQHRARFREMMDERVRSLLDKEQFDGMAELARFLPVAAISELVGLPEEGRASMLDWKDRNATSRRWRGIVTTWTGWTGPTSGKEAGRGSSRTRSPTAD